MEFKLRPWSVNDLQSLVKYANNFKVARNMMNMFPHPYTESKGKSFIENASASKPVQIFAIEVNNEAVGAIGIHPQTDIQCRNAELGYWLGEPFWGKGIMTRAISQMIKYSFDNFDIDRIFARPFGTNIGSQKALEKAGFILEARFEKTFYKNDEYLDELIYAVRRKA